MIGKTIKGASFRGLLNYLAGREGAELVGGNMEGTNPRELAREFGFSRAMRPTLGKAVCHIPLRLPYDEHLSVQQWQRVAERVIVGMGFGDCSYALYLHPQDPQGEHLHIVASRVSFLGDAVDDGHDMYRLMRIERRIEQDYGLREVPLVRNAARRAGRGELKLQARTGQVPVRQQLQAAIAGAARPGLPVAELVAALERQGVELRPSISSTGRVTGLRYRLGEYTFSGTSLGADYTWPGLQGRLGLAFDPARDLPALVAAGQRFEALEAVIAGSAAGPPAEADAAAAAWFDDTSAAPQPMEIAMPDERINQADSASVAAAAGSESSPPPLRAAGPAVVGAGGPEGDAGGTGAGGEALASYRPATTGTGGPGAIGEAPASYLPAAAGGGRRDTADQVVRQLAALGSPRYDLLVLDAATGEHRHLRSGLTPAGVVADVPWLKHLNAGGCEILVRPSAAASLTHFEGVHLPALQEASAAGFQPAAVLRAPDGAREVWMRGGADLPPTVQELVDRELARQLRPGHPPQAPGFGHLAGFTSPLAQRDGGLARPPFLTLEEDRGRVYSAFRALAAETRAQAAAQVIEARAEREIAALRRPAAEAVGAAPAPAGLGRPAGAAAGAALAPAAPTQAGPGKVGSAEADAPLRPPQTPRTQRADRRSATRPASPQAALRELLAITDQEAQRRGLAGPARLTDAKDIEQDLARWTAARKEHAEALAAAGAGGGEAADEASRRAAPYRREARVVATLREQEAARHSLADRLGVRDVRDDLPADAAVTLARWQASLAGAEERLDQLVLEPGATASERLEGAVAVRTLREELADAARAHGLELREPAPGVASALLAAPDEPADTAAAEEARAASPAPAAAAEPAAFELASNASQASPGTPDTPGTAAQAAGPPAAPRMDTPHDLVLVIDYEDVRHGPDWHGRIAAELALEEREAALRAQLLVVERAHERTALQLDALEARLERQPTSAAQVAHQTLVDTLLNLEQRQVPLVERVALLADHRTGRDLDRLEHILEWQASAPEIGAMTGLLEERRQLGARLERSSAGHVELQPLEEAGRPPAKATRERFDQAVENLLQGPSLDLVYRVQNAYSDLRAAEERVGREAAAGELRAAYQELRRNGDALLGAAAVGSKAAGSAAVAGTGETPSAAQLGAWRRALDRYQAAETAVAGRLDAAASAADSTTGNVGTLVLRLHRGDLSPDTLARLQRAICGELRALGRPAGPLPAAPAAASLVKAVAAWKAGRAALMATLGTIPRGWQAGAGAGAVIGAPSLGRLRANVARYQAAAAGLNQHTQAAARTPGSPAQAQTLGPRFFLNHAAFAGQPHRAVAAWAAHVAGNGVAPAQIPQRLARAGGARTVIPRLLSAAHGHFLASAVTRVGLAFFRHFANEP